MTAGTTHRATQENGPSVVDGRLVWTSASGITTADPQSYGGCLRRWWYEKVAGREAPETTAQRNGTELHTEIEGHLKTGVSLKSPLALAGRIYIPTPGSNLFIEKPIHFLARNGVHIYGHVDLYNLRQQYIDSNGFLLQDPPRSQEVKDWKTTASFEYAKTAQELATNIQLNTYSEAGFRMWPDLEWTRHTHVYFLTRGRPQSQLVTIRRSREEVAVRWAYAESVIDTMAAVASETNAERVPGTAKSCNAYKGCPHREYCSVPGRTSLDNLYSKIAGDVVADQQRNQQMGILTNNPEIMNQAVAAPAQPDMRAQLAAEEAQMRAQVQQAQPQADPRQALADACQRIIQAGCGFPALAKNAAQAYAALGGQSVPPGFVYQGQLAPIGAKRSLHSLTLEEPQHIFQLASELDAERGVVQTPPVAPPVQQPSMAQAAPQPQNFTQQVATAYVQQVGAQAAQAQVAPSFLPPDAPVSQPQLAAQPPKPETPPASQLPADPNYSMAVMEQAENAPKKKGRPVKQRDTAPAAQAPAQANAPAAAVDATGLAQNDPRPVVILINARVNGQASRSLADYVDYLNAELSKRYSVTADGKPGIQDVRCVPKESPLAFGGWKGAVRELVKSGAGLDAVDGPMHLDTFMDDLNEAVADALRVVAEQRRWMYVRGVR